MQAIEYVKGVSYIIEKLIIKCNNLKVASHNESCGLIHKIVYFQRQYQNDTRLDESKVCEIFYDSRLLNNLIATLIFPLISMR